MTGNRKWRYLTGLWVLTVCGIVVYGIIVYSHHVDYLAVREQLSRNLAQLQYDYAAVTAQDSIRIRIENRKFDPQMKLMDTEAQAVTLTDILTQSRLIVVFPSVNCFSCYKEMFSRINEMVAYKDPQEVVLLTNYERFDKFKDFVILSRIPYRCFNVDIRTLPADDPFRIMATAKPFVFRPGTDKTVTNICFFGDPRPEILNQYFNQLSLQ